MKRLTKEEFDSFSKGYRNPVVAEAMKLEIGEALHVDFDDWRLLGTPAQSIATCGRKYGKKFSQKMNKEEECWIYLRIQ